jgi:hypothetical protein
MHMSEDNVRTKDSCWSMRMVYYPRGLLGVSTVDPRMDVVLWLVSELTHVISHVCVSLGFGHIAHDTCGPRMVTRHGI